ncbi:hypothetical protein EON63_22020 [archaeon]|nr:MAG: hypothetical protein EON63_22020 [archaeon]
MGVSLCIGINVGRIWDVCIFVYVYTHPPHLPLPPNPSIQVMVDNGCLRKDEGLEVVHRLKEQEGIDLVLVQAEARFLSRLQGVSEPEMKRKIIGNLFIEIFEEEAKKIEERVGGGAGDKGGVEFLLQGTLYPDVIESTSYKGPSHTIKTHHNVGGLPAHMSLKLLEPLRELFKDEVRIDSRGEESCTIHHSPYIICLYIGSSARGGSGHRQGGYLETSLPWTWSGHPMYW